LEAIHRFCNRLQGRRYVAGTWLQPAFVIVSSRGEREAPSDLTLIRSMDPARPPDTKQMRSITRIPIVRMYIYRVLPFNRSSKTKQERKKGREERKTKRSHGNQVRELILYLTVNILLRLDVSPYNARCFLPITVPLIMQRHAESTRRLIMTDKYRIVLLLFLRTEWNCFSNANTHPPFARNNSTIFF